MSRVHTYLANTPDREKICTQSAASEISQKSCTNVVEVTINGGDDDVGTIIIHSSGDGYKGLIIFIFYIKILSYR